MMARIKKMVFSWFTIGIVVGAALFSTYAQIHQRAEPYSAVQITDVNWVGHDLVFTSNFTKNDSCIFEELRVFTESNKGSWNHIAFYDLDPPKGDRFEGEHTLRLGIKDLKPLEGFIEGVEVRTRHSCRWNGNFFKNDKVFVHFSSEDVFNR